MRGKNIIVCGLYLYLQYDHQMCLVDTRTGVASGEGPFSIVDSVLGFGFFFGPDLQR